MTLIKPLQQDDTLLNDIQRAKNTPMLFRISNPKANDDGFQIRHYQVRDKISRTAISA